MDYPVFEIGPGLWELNEFDGASIFLAEGEERALLIDTGIGIGDLRAWTEGMTRKPYDVFLTHNHRDHVGNAPLFPRVYMNPLDLEAGPLLRPRTGLESRLAFAEGIRARHPEKTYPWTRADLRVFTPEEEPEVLPVTDGQVFDLGGRRLTAVAVPGHSIGSMALIDSETGTLFCGDAVNRNIGLGLRPADSPERVTTVAEGLAALRRLWERDFDRTRVYNGHTDYRAPGEALDPGVFPAALEVMEAALAGAETERMRSPTLGVMIDILRQNGIQLRFDREKLR